MDVVDMSTTARTTLLLVVSTLMISAAVFGASEIQHRAAVQGLERTEKMQAVEAAQARMDAALSNFLAYGGREFLYRFESAELSQREALVGAHEAADGDPEVEQALGRLESAADEWGAWARREIFKHQAHSEVEHGELHAIKGTELMAGLDAESAKLAEALTTQREESLAAAKRISFGLILLAVGAFAGAGYFLIIRRGRERARRERAQLRFRRAQDEFTGTLQVMRDEDEAQYLVKNHLEREIDGCEATVLNRNNSDNRLEASTEVAPESPLGKRLLDASPDSCMAIRLGREQREGPTGQSLLTCELCGGCPNESACVPSLVGGEVIGSVLVQTPEALGELDHRRVRQTVDQAAPVLANLRSLAIAESRAATDELTGLPNKRACDDSLRRMLAHAQRIMTPLAVVMLDLDHFKQINDRFGHGVGDDALAAVGDVLSTRLRASDFAGRYGGEEFLLLLPTTDSAGAVQVAEDVRLAIAELKIPLLDRAVTASLGIATHPEHALDAESLLRIADRALYAAKAAGRNRVHLAEDSGETEFPAEITVTRD
jgi:diguanylate cyclase (GGDEF)-like protein